MKKIAVVYQSTYGHTHKYARWLCEATTGAELLEAKKTDLKTLQGYDIIVYLGSIYVGSVNGFSLIAKNYEKLKDKQLVLCSVGLTFPEDCEEISKVHQKALGQAMAGVPAFYLHGGMAWDQLGFLHRSMMKMLTKELHKKVNPSQMDQAISSGKNMDFLNKDALQPVIHYINNIL